MSPSLFSLSNSVYDVTQSKNSYTWREINRWQGSLFSAFHQQCLLTLGTSHGVCLICIPSGDLMGGIPTRIFFFLAESYDHFVMSYTVVATGGFGNFSHKIVQKQSGTHQIVCV